VGFRARLERPTLVRVTPTDQLEIESMGKGTAKRIGSSLLHFVALTLTALSLTSAGTVHAQGTDNLLRRPSTKLLNSNSATSVVKLRNLIDGDQQTIARLIGREGSVNVVFEMGASAVTAERLKIRLGRVTKQVKVELLLSIAGKDSGYSVIRSDVLSADSKLQVLPFQAAAARWVMIRFTPTQKGQPIEVAEVELWGSPNAPATKYEFAESPAKALDVLTSLKTSKKLAVKLSRDELSLFSDARDGRLDHWSFAEAALISSGVLDSRVRSRYLKKIETLEKTAKQVTMSAGNDFEKAERLLQWMHSKSGPLSKGYRADQTDLSTVLDTGTYNCVSSATLYNILGKRLKLDLRAIEVPDHAFSILYDGQRFADVETTTAHGFNPARDREAQKQFEQQTGFRYIPDRHRAQRREINATGLVAVTYYNHGVTLSKQGNYQAALFEYFRAMSLDPEFNSSVKNALAAMVNWGLELANDGDFEQAVRVIETGLKLAPADASLNHNRKVAYTQWALELADSGRDSQALEVLSRAGKLMKDKHFDLLQATIFIRRGEALVKSGRWEAAWDAVAAGLKAVQPDSQKRILQWQRNYFLRWANAELDSKRFSSAVNILVRGLKDYPNDGDLLNNLAYVIQNGSRHIQAKRGNAAALEFLSSQCERFADIPKIAAVAKNHAKRVYFERRGDGEFKKAIETASEFSKFFEEKEYDDLLADGYSSWAIALTKQNRWQEAFDVLATGLRSLPAHSGLQKNLAYVVQQWSRQSHKANGVAKTNAILQRQVARFQGEERVAEIAIGYARRVVYELLDAKKYSQARDAIQNQPGVLDLKTSERLAGNVYDQWSNSKSREGNWQGAIDIYTEGMSRYPDLKHLQHNAVVTWQKWARTHMDKKQWAKSIDVFNKALVQFPKNGGLQNNLRYCQQQLSKE
jgi:tetratricopeptide (TPR) repeat protein